MQLRQKLLPPLAMYVPLAHAAHVPVPALLAKVPAEQIRQMLLAGLSA